MASLPSLSSEPTDPSATMGSDHQTEQNTLLDLSTAYTYKPLCECYLCRPSYTAAGAMENRESCVPYTGPLADKETSSLCNRYRTQLFDDLHFIDRALNASRAYLHQRWLKKSNTERKTHLKRIRHAMPEHENGFFDVVMNIPNSAPLRKKYRETFLLPWLTIDTLSKDGSKLLRLLDHRVRYAPDAWVSFDSRQLQAGWTIGAFDECLNAGCVIMYGDAYGQWKPFNEFDGEYPVFYLCVVAAPICISNLKINTLCCVVHNGLCYGVPKTVLVLEAQTTLARFLRDFLDSMLANTPKLMRDETSITFDLALRGSLLGIHISSLQL